MRLIVNLGNSDIKVFSENTQEDPIFRKRNLFITNLTCLTNEIRDKQVNFLPTGELENTTLIHIKNDENEFDYFVKKIDFPILKNQIKGIQEREKRQILKVFCIITKQNPIVQTDTYLLKDFLLGDYGKTVFPNVEFSFKTITFDPSDYGLVLPFYSKFLSKIDLNNTCVSIAQGTPAMNLGLSQSSVRIKPNIRQYYASNDHENDDVKIKPLVQFSEEEISNQINQLQKFLINGSYDLAKTYVANNYLSNYSPLENILNYFIYRKNYKFKLALHEINKLSDKTSCFNNIVFEIKENLDYLSQIDTNDFDYSDHRSPYILFEFLVNIEISLKNKDYFYTMALTSAFLDVLGDFVIVQALNLSRLTFINKTGSFIEVDEYYNDVIAKRSVSNKYKDLKTKAKKDNDGIYHLFINRNTRKYLLRWVKDNFETNKFVSQYLDLMEKYKEFEAFKNLRNKLPIAHSVKGISLEIINNSLKNEIHNNEINGLVKDLYSLIKESLDGYKIFSPFYLDGDKFITKIREIL